MHFKQKRNKYKVLNYVVKHRDAKYLRILFHVQHEYTGLETWGNLVINHYQTNSFQSLASGVTNDYTKTMVAILLTKLAHHEDFDLNALIKDFNMRIQERSNFYGITPKAIDISLTLESKRIKKEVNKRRKKKTINQSRNKD